MTNVADFTVEVRDRDFQRLGQIDPAYMDLKFTDVHNGVGSWELKLPNEHPLLPALKTKGAGLIITEHWTEQVLHEPVYSAFVTQTRNICVDPKGANPSMWGVAAGTLSNVTDGQRHNRTTNLGARLSVRILQADYAPSSVYRITARVVASKAYSAVTGLMRPTMTSATGQASGGVRAIPIGESTQTWDITTTATAASTTPGFALTWTDATIGSTLDLLDVQVQLLSEPAIVPYLVYGDNPDSELVNFAWAGTAFASASLYQTRTKTLVPPTTDHVYRTYSGRMRSAQLSQSAEDPIGTWLVAGVDDNVLGAATRVYPDPANASDEQTTSHWESSGIGEAVMKSAVQLNAGAGAIAARQYPWLVVPASLGRGLSVKTSSRFDVLGDLLSSLGAAAGLGWEFRQVADDVEFDVYEPADKTGEVRLDIRNGGLASNELGFTAPSATEVLVMGQGEGAARTILPVTSVAAQDEAELWAIRWESTKDQRQTDDPVELEQAGTEVITEQGETVNSLKVVPSDSPGMTLGRDWYRGDRITVVVDGQETTAVVTQVATSISAAGVIRQVTVGDPVGFNFDAKIASKVKNHEQRIGQVERLIGQGANWGDIANLPSSFPTTWPDISGGHFGRGTAAERDAYFGTPANDAARVALANRKVTWYNTDLGWEESYYAVTGLSGLTARALVAGTASAWYPTGRGPQVIYSPTAQLSTPGFGAKVTNWDGVTWLNGAGWFTYNANGTFTVVNHGRYRVAANIALQDGAGAANFHFIAGTATRHSAQEIYPSLYTPWQDVFNNIALAAGATTYIEFWNSNSLNIFTNSVSSPPPARGEYSIEYIGPNLVSN